MREESLFVTWCCSCLFGVMWFCVLDRGRVKGRLDREKGSIRQEWAVGKCYLKPRCVCIFPCQSLFLCHCKLFTSLPASLWVRQETWRLLGISWLKAMQRGILSFSSLFLPSFSSPLSLSPSSYHFCVHVSSGEASRGRNLKWIDGQMEEMVGGQTGNTCRQLWASHYMSHVALFLVAPDTTLNPCIDDEGQLVTSTCQHVRRKKTYMLQVCKPIKFLQYTLTPPLQAYK